MSWRTVAWGCLGLTVATLLIGGWVALGVLVAAAAVMAEIGASQW